MIMAGDNFILFRQPEAIIEVVEEALKSGN